MKIKLKGFFSTRMIMLNEKPLHPYKSLTLIRHSPDGFYWGYSGSGPAQLALAICLEIYGRPGDYQEFKNRFIAPLPHSDFDVTLDVPDPEVFSIQSQSPVLNWNQVH